VPATAGNRRVGFSSLHEAIDTTTPGGRLVFHVFAALAEFERDLIRDRTQAGLAVARARGRQGGRPSLIASVASFFVSRVDVEADARLGERSPLRGRVAIANAHRAYVRFRARSAGERSRALQDAGAHAQRPLWASTATKDPADRDVRYVEGLLAPGTVITLPEATLRAFADHGEVGRALSVDAGAADETLRRAVDAGVDLDAITFELERDGVRSFCDAYDGLLACIEHKLGRAASAA
jgi:transaldolase